MMSPFEQLTLDRDRGRVSPAPSTPPSKRIRTRRFAPWQQACSRSLIDLTDLTP